MSLELEVLEQHLAEALIKGNIFSQDECPGEGIVHMPLVSGQNQQLAKLNARLATKHRVVLLLSHLDGGESAALMFREKKGQAWSFAIVSDSYVLFGESNLAREFSRDKLVKRIEKADALKNKSMLSAVKRLNFDLSEVPGQGTFVGEDSYPRAYDKAGFECSFLEAVALAFLHVNHDVLVETGIPRIVDAMTSDFTEILARAAKSLARKKH